MCAQPEPRMGLKRLDLKHLWHPVADPRPEARQGTLVFVKGEGIYLEDEEGRRFIDGLSALWNVNIGHGRQEIAEAIYAQAHKLAYSSSFGSSTNDVAVRLGERLAELAPPGFGRVFYTSGGSEANETAFKLARMYWSLRRRPTKWKVLSRRHAYHGVTLAAMSATGIEHYWKHFGPATPGFFHAPAPYAFRGAIGLPEAEAAARFAQQFEDTLLKEGPETVAAAILEPIQCAGGVIVPPAGYLRQVTEICRRHEILLIADEVITGFGRTGAWFASGREGFEPDLITVAKGITSGYLPLGGVLISERVAEGFLASPDAYRIMHGFTYYGHPLACAAALANLDIMEREDLPANAHTMGELLRSELRRLLGDHPRVGEIRGEGLLAGIDFVSNRETRAAFAPEGSFAAAVVQEAVKRGLLARALAAYDIVALAPPLIVTAAQVQEMARIVAESVAAVG